MRSVVCAILVAACGDRERAEPRSWEPPSRLEIAIARDLATRLGDAPVVHCARLFGVARGCTATLADRSTLAIRVHSTGTQWSWRVDGLLVDARPIEAYVTGVLVELGAGQGVDCGPKIVRHLAAGGRVDCALARGGKAFVTIDADGAMALELALEPEAARARSEEPKVKDLERASRALQHTEDGDDNDDEGATSDAGVESAP